MGCRRRWPRRSLPRRSLCHTTRSGRRLCSPWPSDRDVRSYLNVVSFTESLSWAALEGSPRSHNWGFRFYDERNWYGVDLEDVVRGAARLDTEPAAVRAFFREMGWDRY